MSIAIFQMGNGKYNAFFLPRPAIVGKIKKGKKKGEEKKRQHKWRQSMRPQYEFTN